MPRIFLIHGWGGSSKEGWIPWATRQLLDRGYEAIAPDMPDTNFPTIDSWVGELSKLIDLPQDSDILIGHSIGCQTILRYLEGVGRGKVNQVILVAPWFTLTNLEDEEAWKIADPWLKTPIDTDLVKSKANKFICIFSDNDPWVPFEENKKLFKKRLHPEIITLKTRGHITGEEGSLQLPELLAVI